MNRGSGNSSKKCSGKTGKSCPEKSSPDASERFRPDLHNSKGEKFFLDSIEMNARIYKQRFGESVSRLAILEELSIVLLDRNWCPAKAQEIILMHSERFNRKNKGIELSDSISVLPINPRYIQVLEDKGIMWIHQLMKVSRVDLLTIYDIGVDVVERIIAALRHLKPTSK